MAKYQIKNFKWLVRSVFRDVWKGRSRRVWVLGAGASVESGIPGAARLAYEWSCELLGQELTVSKEECIKQWKENEDLKQYESEIDLVLASPGPNGRRVEDFLARKYFDVYERRFSGRREGYDALREAMAGRLPSVGYHVLAHFLNTKSNLVITVNFDNLIADAIYLSGERFPLVLDHENIAHLAVPLEDVTLVCKIHRDLLKGPLNMKEELERLHSKWKEPLDEIFKYYSPIFIGYGGNDQTLMDYLSDHKEFLNQPIWLHHSASEDEDEIRSEVASHVTEFLDAHNGILVAISGFDRLMHYAQGALKMPSTLQVFRKRSKMIRDKLGAKILELSKETGGTAKTDPISKAAVAAARKEKKRSMTDWITLAESVTERKERIIVYDDAIKELAHPWLFLNRGVDKSSLGDKEGALADFDEAIRIDPEYATAYSNRGNAKSSLGDKKGAIADYGEAIRIDPELAVAYSNRGAAKASLGDKEGALADFDEAIRIDPEDDLAYYNRACAYALLREAALAAEWLDSAIQKNRSNTALAKNDNDFDQVRETPEFKALMEKYKDE